jgi:hypothetical protein
MKAITTETRLAPSRARLPIALNHLLTTNHALSGRLSVVIPGPHVNLLEELLGNHEFRTTDLTVSSVRAKHALLCHPVQLLHHRPLVTIPRRRRHRSQPPPNKSHCHIAKSSG